MGHPFLSAEEIRDRNAAICARKASEPRPSNIALASEFGLNRETIRAILLREEQRLKRNERIRAKFDGVF
jgi:hypothetical protein